MATAQTGPRLRVEGSCEGCCHLRTDARHPTGRWRVTTCAHSDAPYGRGAIVDLEGQGKTTPAWCPELPAARLALARGIVAEAPCQVSLVRQIGGNLPCIVKGEHVEHRSACGRRWGGEDFTDHPDFDSRAFCDDGSEAP